MFTGIVEEVGRITELARVAEGAKFVVSAPKLGKNLRRGDSVAVNGVCQTVTGVLRDRINFTAVGETLKKTTLGRLTPGAAVNLEAAATPETRLGGHFVQGHVDGVGVIEAFDRIGQDKMLTVRLPEAVRGLVVDKGSIAVDGVSLTVVALRGEDRITITVIPYTVEHTIAANYRVGTEVNIEADVIGKYVMAYLSRLHLGKLPG